MKSAGRGSRDSDKGGRFGAGFRRDFASSSQRVPGGDSAGSVGAAEFGLALKIATGGRFGLDSGGTSLPPRREFQVANALVRLGQRSSGWL